MYWIVKHVKCSDRPPDNKKWQNNTTWFKMKRKNLYRKELENLISRQNQIVSDVQPTSTVVSLVHVHRLINWQNMAMYVLGKKLLIYNW